MKSEFSLSSLIILTSDLPHGGSAGETCCPGFSRKAFKQNGALLHGAANRLGEDEED
jgi:hypothetical protein